MNRYARLALIAVFALGALWCIYTIYSTSKTVGSIGSEMESKLAELEVQRDAVTVLRRELDTLEKEQRRDRKDYTGEQAVLMSNKVQDTKADFDLASAERQRLESEYSAMQTRKNDLGVTNVRTIAFLLISLVGLTYFFLQKPQ